MDVDVLVVGAGPAGLTAAAGLAAAGLAVRVVDRAAGPAATSRANILHARGVEVLTRMRAVGDLPAYALEPVGMAMHARGKALATMRFSPDPRSSTQALFISQATIEGWLRDRLTQLGVAVEWGREVTGVEQDATGVDAGFADGGRIRAGWLLGCDGAHSTVRRAAGIDFPGVPVIEQFLLADVHADWDRPRDVSGGWFHRDGMLLAMPMRENGADGNLWRLMADVPPAGRRLEAAEIVERLRGLLAERGGQTGIDIHDTVWTSVFRVQRRLVDDYRAGRILLAGDAAHIHSPLGGQGMNTGIGDAENLAWKLALVHTGRAAAGLLDSYTAERRPLAAEVLRNTTNNTKLLAGENLPTRLLRDWFIVPVMKLPAVQRQATRVASQLGVTYRDGPLGGKGGEPRPGDRIGDRDCRTTDGHPARLYDHLGPGWVLLAGPSQDVTVPSFAESVRRHLPDATPLHGDGPGGEVWLIRPDGHLGWRGTDPARLADWLERTLLAKPAG